MTQLMAPMDCRNFRKHHLSYLDDTLSGDQMAAAQRHILACDACASHDTMVRRSLIVARNMPSIEPSTAFQERLQARLAECRLERVTRSGANDGVFNRRNGLEFIYIPPKQILLGWTEWFAPTSVAAVGSNARLRILNGQSFERVEIPPDAPRVRYRVRSYEDEQSEVQQMFQTFRPNSLPSCK